MNAALNWICRIISAPFRKRKHKTRLTKSQITQLMTSIEKLNTSIGSLTSVVDRAITALSGVTPNSQVEAAADAVGAQAAKLAAAIEPATPAAS